MPKFYEDKEEDGRACSGIREDFKACLLQHDCVVKEGKMPSQCLKEGHCKALQTSFFECKRSMVRSPVINDIHSTLGISLCMELTCF
uniref:Cytochrome c oxidase assembly factor 5 n=1 Tax=Oncorhynchus tshawytscha TaxID=74940 RepID=A0A8C8D7N9_ONCTS